MITLVPVRFALHTAARTVSTGSQEGDDGADEDVIFLGDDKPITLGVEACMSGHRGVRMSAKQRRFLLRLNSSCVFISKY